jgi:hypothetical protein
MDLRKRAEEAAMDLRKRTEEGLSRVRETRAGQAAAPLATGLAEVLAILREMLAIPLAMILGLAERLGDVVLAAWRLLLPVLVAALGLLRRALRVAERVVTPARAIAAVAIAAAVLLAISQFAEYREVRAGVPAYSEVESIAPAPQISGSADDAGTAHLYLPLLGAVATVAIVVLAMRGRWRLARVLFFIGAAVVVLSVAIDVPNGLDEGDFAIQFEGAEARLLGAFWVQVFAGGVIAVCGPALAAALRPQSAGARRATRASERRPQRPARLGGSGVEGARS